MSVGAVRAPNGAPCVVCRAPVASARPTAWSSGQSVGFRDRHTDNSLTLDGPAPRAMLDTQLGLGQGNNSWYGQLHLGHRGGCPHMSRGCRGAAVWESHSCPPLSHPRRRARYTTMLPSSSTTWATASRSWPSWWPLSSFCGLGEKDSALAPGLELGREGRCKGQLWVRGCWQGGGAVLSPQWEGVTEKQVPGPLEPQAGPLLPPHPEPSPCQGHRGWLKPRLACATLPAPGCTHLEGQEVEPFGFKPGWAQNYCQGCSRPRQEEGWESASVRPACWEGGILLETVYFLTLELQERRGAVGGGASPASKKPPVPTASAVWQALPSELWSGQGSGRKGLGRAPAATSRCDLASEPCPQFPHPPIWAGGMLAACPSPPPLLTSPTLPSPLHPQEHPMPEEHHPLELDLRLHPAQCHVVCGPAHHEPRGPPEQRGVS